jgi:hypothetical protein
VTLQRQVCVILVCDSCGDTGGDWDESCTLHFDAANEREIREFILETGWTVDGSRHFCPECSEVRREKAASDLLSADIRTFLPELTEPLPGMGT